MLDQVNPNLLEIKNLRIEATSYPPGEAPRHVVLVDDVLFTARTIRAGLDAVMDAGRIGNDQ